MTPIRFSAKSIVTLSLSLPLLINAIARSESDVPVAKSPAEQKIELANKSISINPENVDAYNALALALSRRARETADPAFYDQAAEALTKSLALAPDNFEAKKIEAWLALGKHEFARALELARILNKRRPDDFLVYSLLTDACIETGHYDEAEKAAQWGLDMRPGDISGLTRASYLRELFGQIDGAIELMQSAYNKTEPAELENRAWILTQIAHLQLLNNKPDLAEKILDEALRLFPGYHYALGNRVKVRTAQKRFDDAVTAAQEFYKIAPHPENLFVVGDALTRAGKAKEAKQVFAEFEKKALAESKGFDNANRELIFYFADHAGNPEEAMRIATQEFARRKDVHTLHAYAWALHVNDRGREAREQIDQALAIGIRDPLIFYHAGVIAAKLDDRVVAKQHLNASLAQAPNSEVSESARLALVAVDQTLQP
ncbi:MAG: tetratricopeptide repeat protein [Pirellulaceae bacterium]|nr:tetratricopeptide repeat protein [Pirellulaceae bacterium]